MAVVNHWNVHCTVGRPVGPIKVEHQESASSTAELIVEAATVDPGQEIVISYNGQVIFKGVVDEAEDLYNGLIDLKCTTLLQGKVNGMTRAQINDLFDLYSPWHPSLSDDVKQGWEYLEDRIATFYGMVTLNDQGDVDAVRWQRRMTQPSNSEILEGSYIIKKPPYRDLVGSTVLEVEYRCETFEEAHCIYSWSDDNTGWWGVASWTPSSPSNLETWQFYWEKARFEFDLKLAAIRPQAHEIWSMLQGTGWRVANIAGDEIVSWRENTPADAQVKTVEIPLPVPPSYTGSTHGHVINVTPTVSAFTAHLVKRYSSEVVIEAEHAVGDGVGATHRETVRYRYEAERVSPIDYIGAAGTVRSDWEDQLQLPPQLNLQDDFERWLNAHRYRVGKQQAEVLRNNAVVYRTACNPSAKPDGAIIRVVHELDADAGIAITEVEVCRELTTPPDLITPVLSGLRDREEGPVHALGTRTLHGPIGNNIPAKLMSATHDEYGFIKTVNGYLVYSNLTGLAIGAVITNAAKNSFRLPRPEYSDTGPRALEMLNA